jgi:hypothetical protein
MLSGNRPGPRRLFSTVEPLGTVIREKRARLGTEVSFVCRGRELPEGEVLPDRRRGGVLPILFKPV